MLSRTAENLYWLARYVERAEYLARTMEATLRVTALPNTYIGQTNEWDSALLTAGVEEGFYGIYDEANEQNVVEFLSFSSANPSSIRNCIENARLNSRSVLRSVSALTAYHWVYRETLKPWLIADLLILNETLPRSLASCYSNLVRNLDQIGVAYRRQGAAQRHARGVRNRLEHSNMNDIFQRGVHEFIQEFITDNSRLGEIITKQYLI